MKLNLFLYSPAPVELQHPERGPGPSEEVQGSPGTAPLDQRQEDPSVCSGSEMEGDQRGDVPAPAGDKRASEGFWKGSRSDGFKACGCRQPRLPMIDYYGIGSRRWSLKCSWLQTHQGLEAAGETFSDVPPRFSRGVGSPAGCFLLNHLYTLRKESKKPLIPAAEEERVCDGLLMKMMMMMTTTFSSDHLLTQAASAADTWGQH